MILNSTYILQRNAFNFLQVSCAESCPLKIRLQWTIRHPLSQRIHTRTRVHPSCNKSFCAYGNSALRLFRAVGPSRTVAVSKAALVPRSGRRCGRRFYSWAVSPALRRQRSALTNPQILSSPPNVPLMSVFLCKHVDSQILLVQIRFT